MTPYDKDFYILIIYLVSDTYIHQHLFLLLVKKSEKKKKIHYNINVVTTELRPLIDVRFGNIYLSLKDIEILCTLFVIKLIEIRLFMYIITDQI